MGRLHAYQREASAAQGRQVMIRLARVASLLVTLYLLTSAATAYAECAWVLWYWAGHLRGARFKSSRRGRAYIGAMNQLGTAVDKRALKVTRDTRADHSWRTLTVGYTGGSAFPTRLQDKHLALDRQGRNGRVRFPTYPQPSTISDLHDVTRPCGKPSLNR